MDAGTAKATAENRQAAVMALRQAATPDACPERPSRLRIFALHERRSARRSVSVFIYGDDGERFGPLVKGEQDGVARLHESAAASSVIAFAADDLGV